MEHLHRILRLKTILLWLNELTPKEKYIIIHRFGLFPNRFNTTATFWCIILALSLKKGVEKYPILAGYNHFLAIKWLVFHVLFGSSSRGLAR